MSETRSRVGWYRITEQARIPERMTKGAAGWDLHACLGPEGLTLEPGERRAVPTGFALVIPLGMEGQIRPRSGLALRKGVTLLNSPGTIDADYRGEISVLLVNLGSEAVHFAHGDRIAQLVFATVAPVELEPIDALPESERGEGGFGSTGVAASQPG